jgi:hypothetical protein
VSVVASRRLSVFVAPGKAGRPPPGGSNSYSYSALGPPTQAIGSETDRELLELGQKLRAHIAREEAFVERVAVLSAELEERCPFPDWRQVSRKDLEAAYARRGQVSIEIGHDQAVNAWNEVHDTAEPLLREISRTRATSFPGLLVKAEAMIWEATSWTYNPDFPPEWKDDQILDLVATLFAAGQQPVPVFILDEREAVEYRESDDEANDTKS